jgi:type I restriction enzyme, S subunit
MGGEWKKKKLAEVMDVKHGFAFPGESIRDEPPGDILLTPGNVAIGGGFKGDKFKYFDGHVPDDYVLKEGELIVTMTDLSKQADTLGYPAFVPKRFGSRFLHNQRLGKVLIKRGADLDQRFLFYLLRTAEYRHEVLASATGTTVRHTSPGRILAYKVRLPPLAEQRAISSILGALDDKIDLNRRLNETLEAMARVFFKSRFVDTPEGDWKTAPLAEWVDVLSGGTPSKANPALWNGALKWISPKSMTSIHADECDDYVSEQAIGNGTRLAPKGATLVMVRGMGLHDGVRVSQARENLTFNQDVKALVPRKIEPDLLLFAMLDAQQELHKRVETSGHGTGKMPSEILLAYPITMPAPDVQGELSVHISALNDRIAANRSEMRSLARLRDELLPRLLSGELQVDSNKPSLEGAS